MYKRQPPWGGSLFTFPVPGYGEAPVLLYHTHASEAFTAGSGESASAGRSIVTAGEELARLLEESYGLQVLRHRGVYDLPRRYAYTKSRPVIEKILADNSGIQVVIDLHRDGVAPVSYTHLLETIKRALTPETFLISIMTANNEVGTIEPVAAIGALARERGIIFHTCLLYTSRCV